MTQYPLCGRITNTHGCRGAVKIESFCDTPEVLASLPRLFLYQNGSYSPVRILEAKLHKGFVVALLEGVSDMNAAAALKATEVFADRNDLPVKEGRFLLCDLIGLPVIDAESGKLYGRVTHAESGAAYDMYTVLTENGERLFPAVKSFIREIRPPEGIFVTPIEGLFDEI